MEKKQMKPHSFSPHNCIYPSSLASWGIWRKAGLSHLSKVTQFYVAHSKLCPPPSGKNWCRDRRATGLDLDAGGFPLQKSFSSVEILMQLLQLVPSGVSYRFHYGYIARVSYRYFLRLLTLKEPLKALWESWYPRFRQWFLNEWIRDSYPLPQAGIHRLWKR